MPKSKSLVLITFVLSMLPAAKAAAVSNLYWASGCRGMTPTDQARLVPNGPVYSTAHASGADIVCPIFKTTSGPGLTNDSIASVDFGGWSTVGSSSFSCTLTEYQTQSKFSYSHLTYGNTISQLGNSGSGATISFTINGSGIGGYWDGYWKWNSHVFMYAEITCHLNQNAGISWYEVHENGSAQTGRRITSAAMCAPSGNYHRTEGSTSTPTWGGFLEQDYPTGFSASCGMPTGAGAYVEIAVGPAIGGEYMGCRRNSAPSSWQWAYGAEFDPQYLAFSSETLVCAEYLDPLNGDGRIFAYRTDPNAF